MKHIVPTLICLGSLSVASLTASAQTALAPGGGHETGGGTEAADDFDGVVRRFGRAFVKFCAAEPRFSSCQHLTVIKDKLAIFEVKATPGQPKDPRDGQPRDATNNGRDSITLGISAWDRISSGPNASEARVSLAAHELFAIAQLDGENSYTRSNSTLDAMVENFIDLEKISGRRFAPSSVPVPAAATKVTFSARSRTGFRGGCAESAEPAEVLELINGAYSSAQAGCNRRKLENCSIGKPYTTEIIQNRIINCVGEVQVQASAR